MIRPPQPMKALCAMLLGASLLASGCDRAPDPAGNDTPPSPVQDDAPANGERHPAATTRTKKSDPPAPGSGSSEGVSFPIPDPLPPEARPKKIETAQAPTPGPAPIDFWVGGSGTEDGLFHYPRAMITDASGSLFVVDKSGRIQKWSPDGRLQAVVRTIAIEQGKPTGLGLDAKGNLLVADTHYCRVLTYSPDLVLLSAYGAQGSKPGRFMLLTCVQYGEGGLHYTADYGDTVARIQVFKEDGTFVRTFGTFGTGPLQFRRPMNLCVDDARDRLYVADAVNHRISVFSRAGERVGEIGGPGKAQGELNFPYDVKLDDQDRLWVAEFGNQRVSVFDLDGRCLGVWGEPGRDVGGLNRTWGLALGPKGRLWLLDSGLDRVYALDRAVVLGRG